MLLNHFAKTHFSNVMHRDASGCHVQVLAGGQGFLNPSKIIICSDSERNNGCSNELVITRRDLEVLNFLMVR